MVNWLNDLIATFIPNESNSYKPHFFEFRSIVIIGIVIIVLSFGAFALQTYIITNHNLTAAVIASALVDLTNTDRSVSGTHMLAVNPLLVEAARLKAEDMATASYFAHTSPEGKSPWHWFALAGYDFSYAGENLAVRFSDSVDVERAWMNSPTHRANIVNEKFTEIGIATAEGMYEGQPAVFVVQMFGTPAAHDEEPIAVIESVPDTVADVLGAESSVVENRPLQAVILENDSFIATNKTADVAPVLAAATSNSSVSLLQKLATSPRTLLNTLYVVMGGAIAVLLALFVGIEPKRQYPVHVFMGVMLIVLMASILFLYEFASPGILVIT